MPTPEYLLQQKLTDALREAKQVELRAAQLEEKHRVELAMVNAYVDKLIVDVRRTLRALKPSGGAELRGEGGKARVDIAVQWLELALEEDAVVRPKPGRPPADV